MLTRDFIEKFMALENKNADIYIMHLLYGNQKMNRYVLHPFVDEGHIGLIIEDEKRYITVDELCMTSINEHECRIKSDTMEVCIKF